MTFMTLSAEEARTVAKLLSDHIDHLEASLLPTMFGLGEEDPEVEETYNKAVKLFNSKFASLVSE